MARPVRLDGRSLLRALESSFENVPLFGRPTDEPLKFGRDGLSAPGHVLSQTTRTRSVDGRAEHGVMAAAGTAVARRREQGRPACLLYTSDAADDLTRVDLGGRRIIKKKNKMKQTTNYYV